ncbi:MAG: VOC family protein [Alphaproteobacteria bacterium]
MITKGPMYFEIQADDPERAIGFYAGIFGWTFTRAEGLPIAYWRIETGGIGGGLLGRPAKTPPQQCGTNAYTCSMEVEDFDDAEQKILKAGGIVALPKFAVPGKCWQGYFLDTEGNTLGIFEVDSAAG